MVLLQGYYTKTKLYGLIERLKNRPSRFYDRMTNLVGNCGKTDIRIRDRMRYYERDENNTRRSLYYWPVENWFSRFEKKNLNPLNHVFECDELQDGFAIEQKESISSVFNGESMEKL